MATDPVLIHVGNAQKAAARWHVPASVILAILSVEGGTDQQGRPVAPGDHAGPASYGQFTYGTGSAYHVRYGDSASETDAIAHYLVDLGYKRNPTLAIASYNGGPANPQAGYAAKVIAATKHYVGADKFDLSTAKPGTAGGETAQAASGDGLIAGGDAVKALTWIGLAAGGAVLAGIGIRRATGATA